MNIVGLLICMIPAALGIVLFGVDNYIEDHPEFIKKFKDKIGHH